MANEGEADLARMLLGQRDELEAEERQKRPYRDIRERHHQARHKDSEH